MCITETLQQPRPDLVTSPAPAVASRPHAAPAPPAGWLQRLDARIKILSAVAIMVALSLTPAGDWTRFAMVGGFLFVVVGFGGVSARAVLVRGLVVVPFLLAAVPLMFTRPGPALWHIPTLGWTVTTAGAQAFATVAARCVLSVLAAILLAASTPFPLLLRGLAGLRLAPVLVSIVGFMQRYAFVLQDEAQRLRRAAASRSACPPSRRPPSALWRARKVGAMIATLLVRALDRSERVHDAMLARGYDGHPRFMRAASLGLVDGLAALVVGVVLVAAFLV